MSLQPDEIKSEIEKALEILLEQKGIELTAKIRPILYANLDRGRVMTFVEDDIARVTDYMWRVVENYQRLNGVLHQLQIEKTNLAWESLLKQMEKWAYLFLLKRGYQETITTWENARECGSEAASKLLGAYFPYDTELEPWARVIVQNVCMKFMRKNSKDVPIVEESYETLEGALRDISDPNLSETDNRNDMQEGLMEAVDQLTSPRRDVIIMKYLKGMTPVEIAKKLGKGVRAVHSLQFHAIRDLRKILTKNRDKLNE
jgi:RNA polymerase sigma factor (sigma-70 family)